MTITGTKCTANNKLTVFSLTCFLFIGSFFTFSEAQMAKGQQKFLGNVIGYSFPTEWSTYWNQVTPENVGKWGHVQRDSKDQFRWDQLKQQYDFAKKNGYLFKQHTFVWGSQDPGWMKGNQLSNGEKKAACLNWMTQFAKEFPDVDMIDVVNEPINMPPEWRAAIGDSGTTGWDWIIWSFEQARELFPKAKLLINEYGIVSDPQKLEKYLGIIKLLQDRDLIDGIGIQTHCFNVDNIAALNLRMSLDKLGETGLPVYPSELDISGDDTTQLARFKKIFPILWEHKSVEGITIWGYREGECWKENTWLRSRSGGERPALKWLSEYVSGENRTYKLMTLTNGKGTVTRTPEKTDYPEGTNVTLTATPAEGWLFTGWSGDTRSTDASLATTMTTTSFIVANFKRKDGAVDLILNGDFTAGTDPWTFNMWEGQGTGSVIDGEYRITVQTTSNMHYNIQVVQPGIALETDKTYLLSFDAYASANRKLHVNIGQPTSPYQTYSGDSGDSAGIFNLTTKKTAYSLEMTMKHPSDKNARVEFSVALEQPSVFIDNVSLIEKPSTSATRNRKSTTNNAMSGLRATICGASFINLSFNAFNSQSITLTLFDIKGNSVFTKSIYTPSGNSSTYRLNRSLLPAGSYIAKVASNGPVQTAKIILSK